MKFWRRLIQLFKKPKPVEADPVQAWYKLILDGMPLHEGLYVNGSGELIYTGPDDKTLWFIEGSKEDDLNGWPTLYGIEIY